MSFRPSRPAGDLTPARLTYPPPIRQNDTPADPGSARPPRVAGQAPGAAGMAGVIPVIRLDHTKSSAFLDRIPTSGRWTGTGGRPGEPRIPRPPGWPAASGRSPGVAGAARGPAARPGARRSRWRVWVARAGG